MNKSPLLWALCTAALLCAAIWLMNELPEEEPLPIAQADAADSAPAEGCELLQTIAYTRCDHSVVRRAAAPTEVYGKSLEDVQVLYPEWQITEYGRKQIVMEMQLPLFCPDHLVLMPDEAGMLCVFRNKYGDALALVNELNIAYKDLSAAAQEDVELGMGFADTQELEQWLESAES